MDHNHFETFITDLHTRVRRHREYRPTWFSRSWTDSLGGFFDSSMLLCTITIGFDILFGLVHDIYG